MKQVVSLILSFTFVFTSIIPLQASASNESVRIVSDYLKNGVVYWDSDWSQEKKEQLIALNKAKVKDYFHSFRDGLTCKETDLNKFEQAYCMLFSSSISDLINVGVDETGGSPETVSGNVSGSGRTYIQLGITTIVAAFGGIAGLYSVENRYGKLKSDYLANYHYLSPADRLILGNEKNLMLYLSKYIGDHQNAQSTTLNRFLDSMDLNFEFRTPAVQDLKDGIEIKETIRITRSVNFSAQQIDVTPHTAFEILNGYYDMHKARTTAYLDAVFKYKKAFFSINLRNAAEKALAEEVRIARRDVYQQLVPEVEKIKATQPRVYQWLDKRNFRVGRRLLWGGGLLVVAGGICYAILEFAKSNSEPVAFEDLPTMDEESTNALFDQHPMLLAYFAMSRDEISQAVIDTTHLLK